MYMSGMCSYTRGVQNVVGVEVAASIIKTEVSTYEFEIYYNQIMLFLLFQSST